MASLAAFTVLLARAGAVQLFVLAFWFVAAVILARPWLAQEGIGEVEDPSYSASNQISSLVGSAPTQKPSSVMVRLAPVTALNGAKGGISNGIDRVATANVLILAEKPLVPSVAEA